MTPAIGLIVWFYIIRIHGCRTFTYTFNSNYFAHGCFSSDEAELITNNNNFIHYSKTVFIRLSEVMINGGLSYLFWECSDLQWTAVVGFLNRTFYGSLMILTNVTVVGYKVLSFQSIMIMIHFSSVNLKFKTHPHNHPLFIYVQSQPNAIPLGLKFYKSLGNNSITKIYLCNAIISPCFIKFQPQWGRITLRSHIS